MPVDKKNKEGQHAAGGLAQERSKCTISYRQEREQREEVERDKNKRRGEIGEIG